MGKHLRTARELLNRCPSLTTSPAVHWFSPVFCETHASVLFSFLMAAAVAVTALGEGVAWAVGFSV